MPSSALRLRDIRSIYELVHECRALGDDPGAWRRRWFARLGALTGADLIVGGEFAECLGTRPRALGTTEWGWTNGLDRGAWIRALIEFGEDPSFSEMLVAYFARLRRDDGLCASRTELLPDASWYRSRYYEVIHLGIGVDHTLQCYRALPGAPTEFNSVTLGRAAGEKDFTTRHKALVREAHAVLAPLVGNALARFTEPSPADLAPRVREVLRCLLEGDSDKQVAARLGISKYTVNQYVKVIFTHFGVTTRPELLARWIRRGWGNGFAWVNGDGHAPK